MARQDRLKVTAPEGELQAAYDKALQTAGAREPARKTVGIAMDGARLAPQYSSF